MYTSKSFLNDDVDKERNRKLKGVDQTAYQIDAKREDRISVFGICSNCTYFHGFETKYGTIYAKCEEMRMRLNSFDPIIKCTYFEQRGVLELSDLKQMAILIDVGKRSIGFINEENEDKEQNED